ncbi:MAG: thiamine-monophosphate kinase [Verrucomicrobia bacterium]|nr:MAG: thiamine-monophosphate kinase [Verrucomicrobiota bacterium]
MLGTTMALDERTLIQRLTRDAPSHPGVVVGPGDDCAVLEVGLPDRWGLLKTDAVVEGVHFTPETDPARVGHKALARALSDIAAMAGEPSSAVVTLAAPPETAPERLERLYAGMAATARRWSVALVGGETTATTGPLLVSVALLGFVEKDGCLLRRGARPGDALFVTGELGGSLAGRHLDFEPRLVQARWLARHFRPRAMIDLSDGLATDLRHLLAADGLGAELLR